MDLFKPIFSCAIFIALGMSINALGNDLQSLPDRGSMQLHYDRPATYFEEALVLGNGTLGATVYGDPVSDRISLNDITLWTGEPEQAPADLTVWQTIPEIRAALDAEDYARAERLQRKVQGHFSENYQPLGTLYIEQLSSDVSFDSYHRRLDISDATAHVAYKLPSADMTRDYFVSAPDSVLVIRLKGGMSGGSPARFSVRMRLTSLLPHTVVGEGKDLLMDGYAAYHSLPSYYDKKNLTTEQRFLYDEERGVHFRTVLRAMHSDGRLSVKESNDGYCLELVDCSEALLLVANVTSFNGFDKDPFKEGRDYKTLVSERIKLASGKSYAELRQRHVADYQRLFNRVSLWLGKTAPEIAALSTDRQLRLYTDSMQCNPELEALYFQYGRYLLISSSRTDGVPANLQGLWNESILPPWSSNYTININLEENYWPAEVTNLSEMHRPMLSFVEALAQNGKTTAKVYFGVQNGWCAGHNSDMWAMACPVGLNSGDPSWANWNMSGAWLSTHIWEHYLFTKDKEYLKQAYPTLKGAAEFCMDWLIEKNGYLLTSPGTSPENRFLTPEGKAYATSYGNYSDIAMVRQCLMDAVSAAQELRCDKDFRKQVDRVLQRLLPYRIGHKGNLQEWYHDWEDQDPRHRHQSHLFGLHPGRHISLEETPELAAACARTLEIKGDKTTGWSSGWRVNLYARLHDAPNAYHIYRRLLSYVSPDKYKGADARRGGGTYPNLLDAHSPFQIDGNFGGCAGVAEMLMQSTPTTITLLPACPEAWSGGHVKGLCARGGFQVSMQWQNGKVVECEVKASSQGGKTTLHCNGEVITLRLKAGEKRTLRW